MATGVHVSVLMLLNTWLKWIHQIRPATLKTPLCVCQPFKIPYLTARVLIKLCWKHIKRLEVVYANVGFFLDLVISLCLQQHNQNFTLVLDHYSQTPPFKCRWNAICSPSWIIMGLFFLKTMFQMANSAAWWQHSVFKKYFSTNNGQRKTKGKGASVVVATEEKKKRKLFFILPTECRAATLGHLSRCNRTAQNMTWQQCFHPPVKTHISIINKSVYLAWQLQHKERDLAPVLPQAREMKTTGLSEVCEKWFPNQWNSLSSFQQHKTPIGHVWPPVISVPYCIFTWGTMLVNLILCTPCGLCCLVQPPVLLRAARVSALTYWREPEESCRVAEANDELHREW